MSRSLILALATVSLIAVPAASVRADVAPWPFKVPRPKPAPKSTDEAAESKPEPKPEPPPRTGPLRSCGSGAPLALAGIATAWGVLWLGGRVAGRMSRRA
jgi:hypothetical protein